MFRLCLVCILFLTLSASAIAQAPTGTIAGTITDESGAVVTGVRVTALNTESGASRTVQTGADGTFAVPLLSAGNYEVRAEAPGFRAMVRPAEVAVGSTVTVN